MNGAFEEFANIVRQPFAAVARAREATGRRAIGCFPLYVPYEVVDAAGMLPVDIYGGKGEMTLAAEYLQTITCYPVRAAFESLLTGDLATLDGAIIGTICTGTIAGGEMWRSLDLFPFYHQLVVPRKTADEATLEYFRHQVERLRGSLEAYGGRRIDDTAIAASIKLYNQSRDLLTQLAGVSARSPATLSHEDFAIVRAAGSFIPRAQYVELLTRFVSSLPAEPAVEAGLARLVLVGSLCDLPQFEILSLIRQAGGAVVEDDTTLGRRAWVKVDERLDPVTALARHYADLPPCPTKSDDDLDGSFQHLLDLMKSSRAEGLIFLRPLYCDLAGLDYTLLAHRLSAAGVPTLSLDVNSREPATGQVQTRIEAFIEMMAG